MKRDVTWEEAFKLCFSKGGFISSTRKENLLAILKISSVLFGILLSLTNLFSQLLENTAKKGIKHTHFRNGFNVSNCPCHGKRKLVLTIFHEYSIRIYTANCMF